MEDFFVFIGNPPIMAKPKKTVEQIIVDCAGDTLGKKYFGPYYDILGDKSGLGKTYDLCYTYRLREIPGILVHENEDVNSIFDTKFDYGDKTIALQIKTAYEYDKKVALTRISELGCSTVKKNVYKNIVKDRMVSENISSFYLCYISTSDGRIFLFLMAEIIDGIFHFYADDDKLYSSSEKQTGLHLNIDGLKLIKYKKVPGLYTVESDIVRSRKSLKTMSQLKRDCIIASAMFNKLNNLILGIKWGDKGLGFEKFFVDYLMRRYNNIALPKKKTALIDFIIVGVASIQLKTSSTPTRELWPTFGRSSVDDSSVVEHTWDHRFFDDPVPVPFKIDKTGPRGENVNTRLTTDIIDSGEKEYHLLDADLYREKAEVFILSELCEDKTLKHYGSFLKRGFYRSKGGENGNQTHFRIKMRGLISSVEDDADSLFETIDSESNK